MARSSKHDTGVLSVGEDPLTIATTEMLRLALPDTVLWTHHPNNFMPINHKDPAQVRRQKIHSKRMYKMGLRKGWPDYDFVWNKRAFFIEMKTEHGRLSVEQKEFKDDCIRLGLPWSLCRTTEEVWSALNDWGLPIRRIAF